MGFDVDLVIMAERMRRELAINAQRRQLGMLHDRVLPALRSRLVTGKLPIGPRERVAMYLAMLLVLFTQLATNSAADVGPTQLAYIGPGAGIALAGSFLAVLAALASALFPSL